MRNKFVGNETDVASAAIAALNELLERRRFQRFIDTFIDRELVLSGRTAPIRIRAGCTDQDQLRRYIGRESTHGATLIELWIRRAQNRILTVWTDIHAEE